jgi:non-ribosomal peptide synthetase component F
MAYVHAMVERYDIQPEDRLSQAFALTFDPSVHDLFVCWRRGACLYVPPERVAMAPASFICEHQLTSWYSTPATAAIMLQLRMVRPAAFPSLRLSLFSGEALPVQLAAVWQQAAPHSRLENLYGPTEATINCTAYTYSPTISPMESVNGIVPIGQSFGQTRIAVVNQDGVPVGPDEVGELLLSGGQLAPGYWRDPVRTAKAFVAYPALSPAGPWYRTGDLVAVNANGNIQYHGRIDDQIKIRGHRVELQEVEGVIRDVSGAEVVVALGWPKTPAGADGIIVFLTQTPTSNATILAACKHRLPEYMIPQEIHHMSSIPLSTSGKIDRLALLQRRGGVW